MTLIVVITLCNLECARGYFRNSTNNDCISCPIGTYSNTFNVISCTNCTPGYTTSQKGSDERALCTGMNTNFMV